MDISNLRSDEAQWFLKFYRSQLSAGSAVPSKEALMPEVLMPVLSTIFIVEAPPQGFFFRLFGTKIADIIGREHSKRFMHEVLEESDFNHVNTMLTRCLAEPIVIATTERVVYSKQEWSQIEVIRCPFADAEGVPRYVAGTLSRVSTEHCTGISATTDRQTTWFERDDAPRVVIPLGAI
ncbi:PAS domain-containing protein [Nisaea sp.]